MKQLVEVVAMHDDVDAMRQYYTERAWAKWGHYYASWPPPGWDAFYRDVEACLDEDPASARAEALVGRFYTLWHETAGGDREIRDGLAKAWADRDHWPPAIRARFAAYEAAKTGQFLGRASIAALKNRGPEFFRRP